MAPVNADRDSDGPDRPPEAMRESVSRFGRRRRRWHREQARALTVALSIMGTGWMVVIPAVAGFFVGRWLDRTLDTGISMSAAFGFSGLCLGCYSAWRWLWKNRIDTD